MSNVYYKKYEGNDPLVMSSLAKELFEYIVKEEDIKLEKQIPIKVHFGEKGNDTFLPATTYDGLIETLKDREVETAFIETNVLYRGARTTKENHIAIAKEHGFTQIPIIIADGEIGEKVYEVAIDKKYFDTVKLGKAFEDYNQILVCAHFKGHGMAGFGGALKQLAMGFASRSGKLAQHSNQIPVVDAKKCVSCGVCVDKCDVDAIEIDGFAVISEEKCVGCAGCIAVCPTKAISNRWQTTNFREKITEYAYGAELDKKNIYINFVSTITEDCDCIGKHMHTIADDIGVFISTDPVALDAACLDLLQNNEDKKLFEKGRETLEHAKTIGFGNQDYNLIEL